MKSININLTYDGDDEFLTYFNFKTYDYEGKTRYVLEYKFQNGQTNKMDDELTKFELGRLLYDYQYILNHKLLFDDDEFNSLDYNIEISIGSNVYNSNNMQLFSELYLSLKNMLNDRPFLNDFHLLDYLKPNDLHIFSLPNTNTSQIVNINSLDSNLNIDYISNVISAYSLPNKTYTPIELCIELLKYLDLNNEISLLFKVLRNDVTPFKHIQYQTNLKLYSNYISTYHLTTDQEAIDTLKKAYSLKLFEGDLTFTIHYRKEENYNGSSL